MRYITLLFFSVLILFNMNALEVKNMGKIINSKSDEFAPSVTADGKTMVFNHKRAGERYQDLYISERRAGEWSRPRPLRILNSPYNDETPFITPEGDIILFASDRDGSTEMPKNAQGQIQVSFDLYMSTKRNNQWQRPVRLPKPVNTVLHEKAPSLSKNRKVLFYTSYPFGDATRSSRILAAAFNGGHVKNPMLLPKQINHGYQEVGFVPAQDQDGFYFSSRRPGGFGGWDIYFVSFSNGKFGTVKNAGKQINSSENDLYLTSLKSHIILCSNRKGGEGKFDLYSASLRKKKKIISFQIRDKVTKKPISAKVSLNLSTGKNNIAKLERRSNDRGQFSVAVMDDAQTARLLITEKGYLPFIDNVDISAGEEQVVELEPIRPKSSFQVHAIHFDFNSAKIKTRSYAFLNKLGDYIRENVLKVTIIGHTDLNGNSEYNQKLSFERAKAVRDYLVKQGIEKLSLTVRGDGKSRPLVKKIGPKFDALNRRTEFQIQ